MESKKMGKMCPRYERPEQYIYVYVEYCALENSIYDMKLGAHTYHRFFSLLDF
jgi:hypothetical protein